MSAPTVVRTVTAWDLIGDVGEFRVAGGTAIYEEVNHNHRRGGKVKLQRAEPGYPGEAPRVVTRYVDGETPIEVLSVDGESR
jgi:hypothetical protein